MAQTNSTKPAFGREYWIEDGGQHWAENIDQVESVIVPFGKRLIESISLNSGDIVLDVGCGGGTTSIEIAELISPHGRVVGIDISPPIIAIAQDKARNLTNLDFMEGDAGVDDLGEMLYDVITSRFGIMFFENPTAAFSNLRKALKPAGRMVAICWRTLKENPWMYEPAEAVSQILPPAEKDSDEKPHPDTPGPFSLGDPARIRFVMEGAGFKDIVLEAVDLELPMGDIDEAVNLLMKIGPAAGMLADASDDHKCAGERVIRDVVSKYTSSEGVNVPGAGWIISATR